MRALSQRCGPGNAHPRHARRYRSIVSPSRLISGFLPDTRSAITFPVPVAIVHPSVPCPVARYSFFNGVGPTMGVPSGVIELTVFDEDGEPASGIKVTVAWEGKEDTFFTGFDPSRSPGFADYDMMPGLTYSVAIDGSDPSVDGLQVASCPDGSEGGWQLEFRR